MKIFSFIGIFFFMSVLFHSLTSFESSTKDISYKAKRSPMTSGNIENAGLVNKLHLAKGL